MKQLWSKDYNELYKNESEEWKIFSRENIYNFYMKDGTVKLIDFFCEQYDINTIIDYGCGFDVNHFGVSLPPHIPVYNYDPFIEKFSTKPNKSADLIVCYNVLNIIEPKFFDDVLDDIYELMNKMFICNIRVPGQWIFDSKFYIEKISNKFQIKEFNCAYGKDVRYLNKIDLFILAEKKQ